MNYKIKASTFIASDLDKLRDAIAATFPNSANSRSAYLAAVDAGEYEIHPDPEPAPPEADWDGFNMAILSNTEFNQIYALVIGANPLVANALPAALTQVASGQTAMFALAFEQLCTLGSVSVEQRETWAQIAESFYLPDAFVVIIRGGLAHG